MQNPGWAAMGSAGPVRRDRRPRAMPVRSSTYLVLGMLRLGASSGYAIKRAADVSTRFFWATSFAQVYPELAPPGARAAGDATRRAAGRAAALRLQGDGRRGARAAGLAALAAAG